MRALPNQHHLVSLNPQLQSLCPGTHPPLASPSPTPLPTTRPARAHALSLTCPPSPPSCPQVRALPNQQQLVLLATSLAVAGADAASVAVRVAEEAGASASSVAYAALRAKKRVNPFAATAEAGEEDDGRGGAGGSFGGVSASQRQQQQLASPSTSAAAGASHQRTPGTASKQGGGLLSGDAALRVLTRDVYERYCGLCKELFMRPVPLPEFMHTCTLLSEQALLNLVGFGAGGGGGKQPRVGGGGNGGQQQHGRISLKVLAQDVRTALQTNPIYRKLIGAE